MSIRLPRLKELNRPLGPVITISTFESQRIRSSGLKSTRPTPARIRRQSPTGTRCNVKYTTQQVDFIDYFRVDQKLPWKEVEVKYAAFFPEDAAKGCKRGPQGLQGVYYRKNKRIPATDEENLLLFDDDNNLKTLESVVRQQNEMQKPMGLLQMHPERAINYPWVTEEHKRQYKRIGRARQAQLDAAKRRKRGA
ncbi:hypothetical protein QIS74_13619 [Colletotrichum tabaci]|uniref:Uncharacterized protein n=1 Tax=Colletotrichum tabaci TaxID=1209068 RepID=A0AAV9SSE0_9PEZI